jgi:hypothetical protein
MLVEARLDAVDQGVALLPSERREEMLHHPGVGVHRRERRPIPLEAATEHQAVGCDHAHPHSPDPKRKTAPRSSKTSPSAHAISQRLPSGSAM